MGVMSQVAAASRVIRRFGQAGILREVADFGPAWAPTQVETDHAVTVALVAYDNAERDGTLIGATDIRALLSTEGLDAAPSTADKLVVDDVIYTIARVSSLAPDGVARFHELQVRT